MGFFSKYDHIAGSFAHGLGQGWQMGLQGMQMREARRAREEQTEWQRTQSEQREQERGDTLRRQGEERIRRAQNEREAEQIALSHNMSVEEGRGIFRQLREGARSSQAEELQRAAPADLSVPVDTPEGRAQASQLLRQRQHEIQTVVGPAPTPIETPERRAMPGESVMEVAQPPAEDPHIAGLRGVLPAYEAREASIQNYNRLSKQLTPYNPQALQVIGREYIPALIKMGISPEQAKVMARDRRHALREDFRQHATPIIDRISSIEELEQFSTSSGRFLVEDPMLYARVSARMDALAKTEEEKKRAELHTTFSLLRQQYLTAVQMGDEESATRLKPEVIHAGNAYGASTGVPSLFNLGETAVVNIPDPQDVEWVDLQKNLRRMDTLEPDRFKVLMYRTLAPTPYAIEGVPDDPESIHLWNPTAEDRHNFYRMLRSRVFPGMVEDPVEIEIEKKVQTDRVGQGVLDTLSMLEDPESPPPTDQAGNPITYDNLIKDAQVSIDELERQGEYSVIFELARYLLGDPRNRVHFDPAQQALVVTPQVSEHDQPGVDLSWMGQGGTILKLPQPVANRLTSPRPAGDPTAPLHTKSTMASRLGAVRQSYRLGLRRHDEPLDWDQYDPQAQTYKGVYLYPDTMDDAAYRAATAVGDAVVEPFHHLGTEAGRVMDLIRGRKR